MFEVLRKKMKLILWITTIMVIPSFILFFGIRGGSSRQKRTTWAGTIFGKKLTPREYSQARWGCWVNAVLMYGEDQLNDMRNLIDFDQEAWNRLLLLQEAKRQGITTNDREVIDRIKGIFTNKGTYDSRLYRYFLRYRLGASPRMFEEEMRNDITMAKLLARVMGEVTLTEETLRQEYQREFEQTQVRYLLVEPAAFAAAVAVTPEDIASYYEKHKEEFRVPEQVNVDFVEVKYSDFIDPGEIAEEKIEEYYDAHREEFKKEPPAEENAAREENAPAAETYRALDEVKDDVRNILRQQEADRRAEEKIELLADRLVNNQNLAETAKAEGLTLKETGLFGRRDPIPAIGWSQDFCETAFRLKPGVTSDVIRGAQGYYLLQVKEKKPAFIPALDGVKDRVETAFRNEKAEKQAREKAQEYQQAIQERKNDFDQAAKELGLELKETEPFTRSDYISGLGQAAELIQAAFILPEGNISQVVATPKGYAVFQVTKRIPADLNRLTAEKEDYQKALLARLRQEHYQEWFTTLKQRAGLKLNPEWQYSLPRPSAEEDAAEE